MRWTDRLDQIADSYVRKTIGMADGLATPRVSFILRHSTFDPRLISLSYSTFPFTSATLISEIGVVTSHKKIASLRYQ